MQDTCNEMILESSRVRLSISQNSVFCCGCGLKRLLTCVWHRAAERQTDGCYDGRDILLTRRKDFEQRTRERTTELTERREEVMFDEEEEEKSTKQGPETIQSSVKLQH